MLSPLDTTATSPSGSVSLLTLSYYYRDLTFSSFYLCLLLVEFFTFITTCHTPFTVDEMFHGKSCLLLVVP
jgi:hypothetical protein